MPPDDHSRLDRLSDAIEAFLSIRDGEDCDGMLDANPELREFLEPMLSPDDQAASAPASAPGAAGGRRRRLGDFELVREIGRGGMGVVFEAWQFSLHRKVAVKVLESRWTGSPRRIERFRREAAAAAKLNHPGIVPIFEVGSQDDVYFFAMELFDVPSLGTLLQERAEGADLLQEFPGATVSLRIAELGAQVAEALQHAHERGVIHRDIKPGNVLVGAGKARLVDFGLAKDLDRESISQTGEFAGTPHYMSPEQAIGKRGRIDHRTDVYSLGVVLYEALTGQRPFDGDSTHAILYEIAACDPVSVRHINRDVPRDLETICLRAFEKHPDDRYATAGALAADLRRFLAHEPIVAKPPSSVTRIFKVARRRPAAATAVILAFLLLIVTPFGFWWYDQHSGRVLEQARLDTQAERKQARQNLERAIAAARHIYERAAANQLGPKPDEGGRESLTGALEFFEGFLEDYRGDTDLRVEVARVYLEVGKVHTALVRLEEAEAALRRAIEVAGEATPREPSASSPERDWVEAAAQVDLGTLRTGSGDRAGGEKALRLAQASWERILEADVAEPWRSRALSGLAWTLTNLGNIVWRYETDPGGAERLYRRALEVHAKMSDESKATTADRRRRATLLTNLSVILAMSNRRTKAMHEISRGIELRKELLAQHPGTPHFEFDLAHAYYNLGSNHRRAGQAIVELGKARDLFEGLAKRFASQPTYGIALARTLNQIGIRAARSDDGEAARKALERAAEIAAELHEKNSTVTDYGQVLSVAKMELGILSLQEGDAEAARGFLEEARGLRETVLAGSGGSPQDNAALRSTLAVLVRAYDRLGDKVSVCECLARSLALLRQLRSRHTTPEIERHLNGQAGLLTRLYIEQKKHAEAAATVESSLGDFPDNVSVARRAAKHMGQCAEIAQQDATLPAAERRETSSKYRARSEAILARIDTGAKRDG